MRPLWRVMLVAAGRGRAALVVASTAMATGLLLVAVSIARLGLDPAYDGVDREDNLDGLFPVVAEAGTRGGVVLAAALLSVPVLLLLDQAVRLGSSDRERRYAALAVAGATRADRRRWGAVEVGLPAAVGALGGLVVWLVLRLLLGTALAGSGRALVPTSVGPGWWALPVIGVVGAAGVLVGVRQGSREAAVLPDAASLRRPPRPWAALLVVLAVVAALGGTLGLLLAVVLLVAGLVGLSPWVAHAIAGRVARRTDDPATLLAARRLQADPGPAGRAAAAVGAVGVVGGVLGPFCAGVVIEGLDDDVFYLESAALVALCLVVAVAVVAITVALHSTETVLQRRRQLAALVAVGVPASVISDSQRAESLMASLPLALLGSVLGVLGYSRLLLPVPGIALGGLIGIAVTVGVVVLAARLATAAMRSRVRDAVRPVHLRVE